jgi:two-component system response regulator AtoC
MQSKRILVVDDEAKMRRVLEIMLNSMGHEVISASNGIEALDIIKKTSIDLILSDLRMPGISGTDLLKDLQAQENDTPVIIMTAYGTIESAVQAMKLGARDYILRPFDINVLEVTINRLLAESRIRQQNDFLKDEVEKGWGEFVGNSLVMQQVYEHIQQVAPGKTTVMITGETGTGKELVARAIHRHSTRRDALFVPINCAAIPADILENELFGSQKGAFTGAVKDRIGKFEMADGGTLFLDEITEMPISLQAKLLRALQENVIERIGSNRSIPIDVRIVAATNRNPRSAIAEGNLREDLYYRINVFNIDLPSLRERKEDISELVSRFLKKQTGRFTISHKALACFQEYDWPGNVRELQNILERATVLSRDGLIDLKHLPSELSIEKEPAISPKPDDELTLDLNAEVVKLELKLIREALYRTGNNKSKAARLLEISERSLWYKISNYKIDV